MVMRAPTPCPDVGNETARWTVTFDDQLSPTVTVSRTQKAGTTVAQTRVRLTEIYVDYTIRVEKKGYIPPGGTDLNCTMTHLRRCTFDNFCV
jgi:hypothetical protein